MRSMSRFTTSLIACGLPLEVHTRSEVDRSSAGGSLLWSLRERHWDEIVDLHGPRMSHVHDVAISRFEVLFGEQFVGDVRPDLFG